MKIEEQSREELIALIYKLAKESAIESGDCAVEATANHITEFVTAALAGFQVGEKETHEKQKKGAKSGHEKQERPLVEKPNKVIEVYVDNCKNCHLNFWIKFQYK